MDEADLQCLKHKIVYYGAYPVNSVSAVANIFVLYVWNAETTYHPTTYLFKLLAVTDIFSAVFVMVHYPFHWGDDYELWHILNPYESGNRKMNVLVTLVLALTRLFKVLPSLDADRLCSRHRMRVAVVVIIFVAFIVNACNLIFNQAYKEHCGNFDSEEAKHTFGMLMAGVNNHVGFSIPALLQMLVMFVVLWRLRSVVGKRQTEERLVMLQRLTYAVVAICFVTFITHFVMRVAVTVALFQNNQNWRAPTVRILFSVIAVLIGFNGLVNVVFYSALVPRFRHLAHFRWMRFSRFLASLRQSTLFPAASPKSHARLPITSTIGQPPDTTDLAMGRVGSLGTGVTSVRALQSTTEAAGTELTEMTDSAID